MIYVWTVLGENKQVCFLACLDEDQEELLSALASGLAVATALAKSFTLNFFM